MKQHTSNWVRLTAETLTRAARIDVLAAREHETDHECAVRLARSLLGRDGSKWHDIDQRLARAVLRLEDDYTR